MSNTRVLWVLLAAGLVACGKSGNHPQPLVDAGRSDAQVEHDAGAQDADLPDATTQDASTADAGLAEDDAGGTSACSVDHGGCDPLVSCNEVSGKAVCGHCPAGYADGSGTGKQCTDIDECATHTDNCPTLPNACTNTVGSFTCFDSSSASTVTLTCGVSTFDGTTFGNWCGQPQPLVVAQSTQILLVFAQLNVASGATLQLSGSKPIVLVVYGDATIDGTIDASAHGELSGPGGDLDCSVGRGAAGMDQTPADDKGAGGGGGGGFGLGGAAGGLGDKLAGAGGAAGAVVGDDTLSPLRGGCAGGAGGKGGDVTTTAGAGGGAGGALQLSVAGVLAISASGRIVAAGGGGQPGAQGEDGGGGGGSGGGVLLEGATVSIAQGAWVSANGGAGASGNASDSANGASGADGLAANGAQASGGIGVSGGGNGGKGGSASLPASLGLDGACFGGAALCSGGTLGAAGGGGGGGVGRIRVNAKTACTLSGSFSPSASKSGCS